MLLAGVTLAALPAFVPATGPTGTPLQYGLTASAVAQGLAVGLLVALLFAIVPLLRVRRIRPSLLLRQEGGSGGRDWVRVAATGVVALALVGVAALAGRLAARGLVVCAGFVAITLVLLGAAWLLVRLTRPLRHTRSFVLRHASMNLDRPGNQTRTVLLAVGLGCFFIVGVRAIERNLLDQLDISIRRELAGHVPHRHPAGPDGCARRRFWRRASLRRRLRPLMLPVLRGRVTAVDGTRRQAEDGGGDAQSAAGWRANTR